MKRFGKTGLAIGLAVTMLMTQVPAGTVMAATSEITTDEVTTEESTAEEQSTEEVTTEELTTEEVTTEELSTEEPESEDKGSEGELAIDQENFPDANFRSYVKNNVDTDKNDILSQEERDACTEIRVAFKKYNHLPE